MNIENIEEIKEYVVWLKECLIADLKEDGYESTVEDFETLVRIVERYALQNTYNAYVNTTSFVSKTRNL